MSKAFNCPDCGKATTPMPDGYCGFQCRDCKKAWTHTYLASRLYTKQGLA